MSEISFSGEFGWEILFTVGHAYKAHLEGDLSSTRGCYGTSPFYYFSDNHKEDLKRSVSLFMSPTIKTETHVHESEQSYLDYHDIYKHDLDISGMVYPPYKQHYSSLAKSMGIKFDNPVLVINNKSSRQVGGNYLDRIDLKELHAVAEEFSDHDIIYIRPNLWIDFQDDTGDIPFRDKEVLRKFSNVHLPGDLMAEWSVDFNTMQLISHSLADKHLSVAGGNALLASHFGGVNVIVRRWWEALPRRVWHTDSYLKNISGSKIIGALNLSEILEGLKL